MEQLIYGSADRIVGRATGGWGVLRSTPGLAPGLSQQLVRLASVSLPQTLPQFPSKDDLAARQPRFRINSLGGGTYLMCRSIEAGADHTGRPGNVVSHCAHVASDAHAQRSIDWYFSEGWVAPYGPRQVEDAAPPVSLEEPGGWASTVAWLREDPSRATRLRWIVDVGLMELFLRSSLILRADTPDEGARWASVLSWMISSQRAGSLHFRIGEDPRGVREQLSRTPVIATVTEVPRDDTGLQILDTTWTLDADEAERTGRWTLPGGQQYPLSSAPQLAADLVYAEPAIALRVFALRDELMHRYTQMGSRDDVEQQKLFLRAAWLLTPGAQPFAREESIRQFLSALGDDKAVDWDEVAALRMEIGLERDVTTDDIYATEEGEITEEQPVISPSTPPRPRPIAPPPAGPALEEALLAAAWLGQHGQTEELKKILAGRTEAPLGAQEMGGPLAVVHAYVSTRREGGQ